MPQGNYAGAFQLEKPAHGNEDPPQQKKKKKNRFVLEISWWMMFYCRVDQLKLIEIKSRY